MNGLTQFAQSIEEEIRLVEAGVWQTSSFKMIAAGLALFGAAMALGMFGANYMKALGRNPEAGKAAGTTVVIIAAMIEATALLAFLIVLIG